jgi:hypothetical protein
MMRTDEIRARGFGVDITEPESEVSVCGGMDDFHRIDIARLKFRLAQTSLRCGSLERTNSILGLLAFAGWFVVFIMLIGDFIR